MWQLVSRKETNQVKNVNLKLDLESHRGILLEKSLVTVRSGEHYIISNTYWNKLCLLFVLNKSTAHTFFCCQLMNLKLMFSVVKIM